MRRTYSNHEMEQMLETLSKYLDRKDVIGYAAARNTRILLSELTEYAAIRDALVAKYGEPELDDEGRKTGRVSLRMDSPEFEEFLEEFAPIAMLSHEPELFTIPYDHAIGEMSGTELLEIEWMFEEAKEGK